MLGRWADSNPSAANIEAEAIREDETPMKYAKLFWQDGISTPGSYYALGQWSRMPARPHKNMHDVADPNSVAQLLVEDPVVELLRLPVRPSLLRNRRNTSSSVDAIGLRPNRSP